MSMVLDMSAPISSVGVDFLVGVGSSLHALNAKAVIQTRPKLLKNGLLFTDKPSMNVWLKTQVEPS